MKVAVSFYERVLASRSKIKRCGEILRTGEGSLLRLAVIPVGFGDEGIFGSGHSMIYRGCRRTDDFVGELWAVLLLLPPQNTQIGRV